MSGVHVNHSGPALDRPRITVVIPTYNREAYVGRAIRTALDQSHAPHEVIVVDDASTDNSVAVVEQAGDPRVRLIRRAVNGGGGAARNDGIDAASGTHVAFLDSDDVWSSDKLERQLAGMAGNGDLAVSFTNLRAIFDGDPGPVINSRAPAPGERVADYIFVAGQSIQTSTLLMPTPLAARVRFDDRLRRHQDWDFLIRLDRAGARFSYVAEPMVGLRVDSADDRMSFQNTVEPSLFWIEDAAPGLLTGQARAVFVATYVMPRLVRRRPLHVLRWFAANLASGDLPPTRVPRLLVRGLVPYRARLAIKQAIAARAR